MADNYLERKYEEYLASKGAKTVHKIVKVEAQPLQKEQSHRVLVTGGAQGIGSAIVKAFADKGNRVAFCDINEPLGRMMANSTGAIFRNVDVRDVVALEAFMDELITLWGDIDIIINNVGVGVPKPIAECSVAEFEDTLNINLRPVFVTSRKLAIHRNGTKAYGRIVNICSTRQRMSEAGWEAYATSKGGIYSLTHALSMSMSPLGVTVNSISPGWIQNTNYSNLSATDHLQHPSNRVGKPEDIARMCLFLCEEENDFINAENITIDGGMTRKMIYEE